MRLGIALSLALALALWGCSTMRDTREGLQSGTARVLDASFDPTWAAAVAVMQHYPVAESNQAMGVLVTDWVERLVEPDAFTQHGVLKERARFEITVAARDGNSRVNVHQTVELLAPFFVDPVAPDQKALCQYPWPADLVGPSPSSGLYYTHVCALDNPWEKSRGSPIYVWRRSSQVEDAPGSTAGQREKEILDAIEAALRGVLEQPNAS